MLMLTFPLIFIKAFVRLIAEEYSQLVANSVLCFCPYFSFRPDPWGNDPIWRMFFETGGSTSSTINKDEEISRCTIQVLRGYQKTETDGDSWLAEMGGKMGCKIRLLACHIYILVTS